ncbi:MAG: tetratricopeptide repeat protein [Lysobacterales bacterium]
MSSVADTDLLSLTEEFERKARSSTARELPPGTRFGRYRIERLLGRGGMGVVYQAEQTEPVRRTVAIKMVLHAQLDQQARARFDLERQALASLAHPGVAQLYDAGSSSDGTAYFAMEYVSGSRLDQYWVRQGLDTVARVRVLRDLCRIVGHAHRRGIVHCDLKPANVLVSEIEGDARLRVIDFGIARAIGSDDGDQAGGSPGFMSPEQARSDAVIDARSDVFALGALLRLAVNAPIRAWLNDSAPALPDLLQRIAHERVDELQPSRLRSRQLDALRCRELASLIDRALAMQPGARYADAHELADDLDRWLQRQALMAMPRTIGYALRCILRRYRWPLSIAGAFVAMAAMFALQFYDQYRQTRLERDTAEQVVALLIDTYTAADPEQYPGGSASARELLASASTRVSARDLPAPVRTRVLLALGRAQHSLELYDDARRSFEQAQQALADTGTLEADRIELLQARVESDAGEFDAAEERARALSQRHASDAPTFNAEVLLLRADNAYLQSDYDQAQAFADQAAGWIDSSQDADLLRQLATVRARIASDRGDTRAALQLQQQALDLARELWGDSDLRTLDMRNDLALYASRDGQHALALATLERVAELTAEAWGSDSAGLATVYGNLGTSALRAGDAHRAEVEHRRALAIFQQRLGNESMHTGTELNNLAAALEAQGHADAALPYFEQAEQALMAALGSEHVRVGVTLHNQARACLALGRTERAGHLLERSGAILRPALGEDHPRWAVLQTTQAEFLLQTGRPKEALVLLEDAAPRLSDAFGNESRESRRAQDLIARARAEQVAASVVSRKCPGSAKCGAASD